MIVKSYLKAHILWFSVVFLPQEMWTYILFIISSLWISALVRHLLDIPLSPTTLCAMMCECTRLRNEGEWYFLVDSMQLCCSPCIALALHAVCCAAGARCWDGAHAETAPERRRGFWKCSGSLRGLCLSQRQAVPVQGWGHLHLQRESGVLERLWQGNRFPISQ